MVSYPKITWMSPKNGREREPCIFKEVYLEIEKLCFQYDFAFLFSFTCFHMYICFATDDTTFGNVTPKRKPFRVSET